VLHCAVKNNTLVVYTASPAWSSQIRFYQNLLLAQLAQGKSTDARQVQVKVMAVQTGASISKTKPATLPSVAIISTLKKQGGYLANDSLKASFLKLTDTLQKLAETNQPR